MRIVETGLAVGERLAGLRPGKGLDAAASGQQHDGRLNGGHLGSLSTPAKTGEPENPAL